MKDLGAGGLSAFPVLSATLTLPPPPTFSRWGGAEVWVKVDSAFSPHFFFKSRRVFCRTNLFLLSIPEGQGEGIVWFFGVCVCLPAPVSVCLHSAHSLNQT